MPGPRLPSSEWRQMGLSRRWLLGGPNHFLSHLLSCSMDVTGGNHAPTQGVPAVCWKLEGWLWATGLAGCLAAWTDGWPDKMTWQNSQIKLENICRGKWGTTKFKICKSCTGGSPPTALQCLLEQYILVWSKCHLLKMNKDKPQLSCRQLWGRHEGPQSPKLRLSLPLTF